MKPRLSVVTIGVDDLERAVAFGYAGCFQDPDGHLWEVVWNPAIRVE